VQVPRDIEEAQTMLTRSKSMFKHGVCERERERERKALISHNNSGVGIYKRKAMSLIVRITHIIYVQTVKFELNKESGFFR